MSVRPPALAGRFYPASAAELASTVRACLDHAEAPEHAEVPAAIIGPHAGFVYSGPVAGSAYAMLRPLGPRLRRAILIGPSHHVAFDGVATSRHSAFRTPLGDVAVDVAGVELANTFEFVHEAEHVHAPEHSLETHLPFLQAINPDVSIVPLITGRCAEEDLAALLDALWDEGTVLCVSSDLSHFEDYDSATAHDAATSARIAALNTDIGPRDACGAVSVRGLLRVARERHLDSEIVDLRNSGDTAGGRDRVVGYGAYGFWRQQ